MRLLAVALRLSPPPALLREGRARLLRSDPRVRVGLWPTNTALPLAPHHPRLPILSLPMLSHARLNPPHPLQHHPPGLSRAATPSVQATSSGRCQIPSWPSSDGFTLCCNPTSQLRDARDPGDRTDFTTRSEARETRGTGGHSKEESGTGDLVTRKNGGVEILVRVPLRPPVQSDGR
jgi:hypothetical protein